MPLLWLRIALALYAVGLLYSVVALTRRSHGIARIAVPATQLGLVFHFVSLMETLRLNGKAVVSSVHDLESLLALLLMLGFAVVYLRYRTPTPGILIFPPVFLLTFAAAMGKQPPQFTSPLLRSSWTFAHVALIFAGYAALLFSFAASILYLLQERGLKSKSAGVVSRLPALEVIDQIGYRALLLGFPFMTVGLLAGAALAAARFGAAFFVDPKIVLSVLMWAVYMVLLFGRRNAGWRGRRAAVMVSVVTLAAAGAWVANYFSSVHRWFGQ
jgi:ABC-type uncharacterized transport system permease subunit